MAKRCAIENCGRRLHKNAVENPQSLDLCKAHYVAQGHVQTAKVDCMVIGCVGKAGITGLCKRHTYHPSSLFGLNVVEKYWRFPEDDSETRKRPLIKHLLGWTLDAVSDDTLNVVNNMFLGDIQPQHMKCYYCRETETVSSLGPSPAHACFTCWSQINKR